MIMGRLFEYSRFNNSEDIKKDVGVADSKQKGFNQKSQSPQTKPKPKKYETPVCPSYSELYPDNDIQLKEDTTKSTKSTSKSVEIAIKKYHQLSKFLVHNQDEEKDDCGMIASAVTPKKPKVYDCMRDFLRKKLFQHTISEESESAEYDEDDFLAEIDPFDIDEEDDDECLLVISSDHQSRTKYTQIVENECWSSTKVFAKEEHDVDSDAGIKDCCQLLSGSNSPRTDKSFKSPKRKPMEVPIELRDALWFQPSITSKAATEKLAKELPGAFIIRQSSTVKAGNFILCLRMETKVKKFVILGSPRCYKIKGAKKEFSSLKALVTHHSVMAEQLPVTLALPRPIEEKSSHRYLDDFDTFESLQILGILKFLQAKNLEFS